MTDMLRRAFEAAFRLPEEERDAVTERLVVGLHLEEKWEGRLARTQGALSMLARKALAERESGGIQNANRTSEAKAISLLLEATRPTP